jgi:hypothetical protein
MAWFFLTWIHEMKPQCHISPGDRRPKKSTETVQGWMSSTSATVPGWISWSPGIDEVEKIIILFKQQRNPFGSKALFSWAPLDEFFAASNGRYLLVNVYITNWKITIFNRYINYFYGPFSIAISVSHYQRVWYRIFIYIYILYVIICSPYVAYITYI